MTEVVVGDGGDDCPGGGRSYFGTRFVNVKYTNSGMGETMSATNREILNIILEKLDRIESEILDMKYPEEEKINPGVIARVEAAEKRIATGEGKKYTADQFKETFCLE